MTIVHTTTPSIYNDFDWARAIKEKTGCKVAVVGPHVTAEPDNTFEISKQAIDFVVRGEPDYTLRDLADKLPVESIAGLSYVKDGKVVHNPARPPLNVDELPFPAWHHIDPRWYHDAGKLYPFITLYTGRGCHGLCTFCRDTELMNGRKLRMRSPKLVVDEIEHDLKLFPDLKEVMFETDTFTAIPKHTREVCQEIIQRGLHKKISWSCNVRVDVQLDLLPLMKEAGCRMLMIGFEFGTNEQLNSVKKGTTVEQSSRFAETAHKLGFTLHGCFMIGAPGETPESAQKTIDFAKSLPLDTIQISGIAVYPGTKLYQWAKENNYLTAKKWTEWVNENKEQVTILSYPTLSKNEIDYFIDKGLKEFYLRPRQMFKMFIAIRSWEDVIRKLYGLKSFVGYFKAKRSDTHHDCGCHSSSVQ